MSDHFVSKVVEDPVQLGILEVDNIKQTVIKWKEYLRGEENFSNSNAEVEF